MKFSDFFWPDSSLEQVSIRYDVAELIIWNCNTNCKVIVQCKGFIGMTDLCIWDDQIILQAEYALVRRDPLSGYLPAIPM